ncbi:MAG TPA: pitrilysin family protein [Bdellovibrionales bacterium]|nr:pitrilysin family protein [Bdellovibrionales bacterium]
MFKKYQLKNGIQVLLVESHKSPVLSIQMWVKTGSADEKKGEEGISHFIEHLVFKGSEKYKVGEIASAVEASGGELNAYTSFDQTVFYVTISKEFQKVGFDVISEMMGRPSFDAKEIDNERGVVIEEIKRSHDSPHRQASRLLFSTVYKKHPYGIPVIGFEENINTVSRKTLTDYFDGRYNPKTMTLVVAGDFRGPEMRKQIQAHFGGFRRKKPRVVRRPAFKAPVKPAVVVKRAPFKETIVHLAFPIPKATHKDIAALEIFALILGQGESSRLNTRLRVREHLVNFAGSSVFASRDPGFFALSMSLNESDLEAAMASLVDEVANALKSPPTGEEIDKARTNLASEQYYNLETVDGLARNFGQYQDLFGDPTYFAQFMKRVQSLSAEDILKTARKYLGGKGFSAIVMSPGQEAPVGALMRKWVKTYRKNVGAAVKGKIAAAKGKAARKIVWVAKPPAELRSNVEKWELDNGIAVITRPSFDTPVISLRSASLGGSRLETANNQGATEMLARVWTSGAGPWSEIDLNHRIDALAGSLSAFGGRNSEGLTMTCLKPFTKEMLEMYFTTLTAPHFEETAIKREIKSMVEQVKLRQDNPSQLCMLDFMKNMFGDHPYGRDPYGDEAALLRLNSSVVREAYGRRTGLTIVASGAFDPVEMRDEIQKALGTINPGKGVLREWPIHYPDHDVTVFRESTKQQSHIMRGYPGLNLRDPERYTMQVMQAILAGQGGRLFVELRDKASLAYSVAPMRMEGLEGGYFGAYIGCSPEKTDTALRMMRAEFSKLVDADVPAEELRRAQRYLIGKHDIELQRNSAITSSILFDSIYGIDHMETYHYADRIRTVSAESIRALAKRIFAKPSVTCVVGPTPASA